MGSQEVDWMNKPNFCMRIHEDSTVEILSPIRVYQGVHNEQIGRIDDCSIVDSFVCSQSTKPLNVKGNYHTQTGLPKVVCPCDMHLRG